ncbi:MAG TPA: alpha/beta fold hydrolase [Burkholderiaceae bacterium]|nr:alpha/beta fold hydrolase [Burkholderiaceae bacterium]
MSAAPDGFVEVGGRRIEVARVGVADPGAPCMVFLHEGLGSVAAWRDFPRRLCERLGLRGLLYSRPGYGRSTPRAAGERWGTDFMDRQATEVLPAVLEACGVDAGRAPPWLFGHSDGGSIALIHAARFPDRVAGVVALAPHLFVEDLSVRSIREAREDYLHGGLRERLARFHDDVDSAFFGWNDAWLDPAFERWSIEPLMPAVRGPVLAVQGRDDRYGTMAQIEAIARAVPGTRLLALEGCGHSPHRDRPDEVVGAVGRLLADTIH